MSFVEFLPDPRALVEIEDGGECQFVIFGRQPLLLFSEEPAGYLFDAEGRLLDWSVEADDVDHLSSKWELANEQIRKRRSMNYNDFKARPASSTAR